MVVAEIIVVVVIMSILFVIFMMRCVQIANQDGFVYQVVYQINILIMKNINIKKLTFTCSVISFIYFLLLILYSLEKVNFVLLNVFLEIMTIPFLILLATTSIASIYGLIKEKINYKSLYILSFIICLINILILIYAD